MKRIVRPYIGRVLRRTLGPSAFHQLQYRRHRLEHLAGSAAELLTPRPRVLFYPDFPKTSTIAYRLCVDLGWSVTNDPVQDCDLILRWRDATTWTPDETLTALAQDRTVINFRCNDIRKSHVDEQFRQVFGYALALDPTAHRGPCVQKSEYNAQHDGRVISCPIDAPEEGVVYQKLVNNETGDGFVQDIRVPIIGNCIPFAYLRYHSITSRFHGNTSAVMTRRDSVLDDDETHKLLQLASALGLDYGEIDVLRDREDGRLYAVDVNNTPFGPPVNLDPRQRGRTVRMLAAAFEHAFLAGLPTHASAQTE